MTGAEPRPLRIDHGTHRLTAHVRDRYNEAYPGSDEQAVWLAIEASDEVDPHVASRMAGRGRLHDSNTARFLLHPERSGLFVAKDDVIVTFLRFASTLQRELAIRLYGQGFANDEPPATTLPCVPPVGVGLFMGCREDQVTFSDSAAKLLGGRDNAFGWLVASQTESPAAHGNLLVHNAPGVLEAVAVIGDIRVSVLRRGDGGLHIVQAVYRAQPNVKLTPLESPQSKDKHSEWLGVPLRDIRVSRAVAGLSADSTVPEIRRGYWRVRYAVETKPATATPIQDGWHVVLDVSGQQVEAWVFDRRAGRVEGPEWCVIHHPPVYPTPEQEQMAGTLRAAGWTVEPPMFIEP